MEATEGGVSAFDSLHSLKVLFEDFWLRGHLGAHRGTCSQSFLRINSRENHWEEVPPSAPFCPFLHISTSQVAFDHFGVLPPSRRDFR